MKDLIPQDILSFSMQPFALLHKQWMLLTAAKPSGKLNTMTASWGGFGIMWNKPVAFFVVRPQRFTKEFIDASGELSLSFLPERHRESLSYLGTVSGRDTDKLSRTPLTAAYQDGIPYFSQAETVIFCKTQLEQVLPAEAFLNKNLLEQHYPQGDYHHLYIAEITAIYQKEA